MLKNPLCLEVDKQKLDQEEGVLFLKVKSYCYISNIRILCYFFESNGNGETGSVFKR